MKITDGGITSPKGFRAASCAAKIKDWERDDMALIFSDVPCAAAGVYTSNIVKAAPVVWDRDITSGSGAAQAVVINAGVANACTGTEGMGYCKRTAEAAAGCLNIPSDTVLVASTGVIGNQLPIDKITGGVMEMSGRLSDTREAADAAARAILTTDTMKKEVCVQLEIGGKRVTLAGMCKGSGMIHPGMCTMLAFVTTDCAISHELLMEALRADVQDTFNMVSVDGDMSTNDTLVVLANGMAGNAKITKKCDDYDAFCRALNLVNTELAKKIAGDGEGATCLFEVKLTGAESKEKARALAKSVICSNLVKTAICGHDANWGRILCAMGYSGETFDPGKVSLRFESAAGSIDIAKGGVALDFNEQKATEILSEPHVTAIADIGEGNFCATAWGCDLTHGYININADYRS